MKNLNEYPDRDGMVHDDMAEPIKHNEVIPFDRKPKGNELSWLISDPELETLRSEWASIQADFVDQPRRAVEAADKLVASAVERIAATLSDERRRLETAWIDDKDVSTEDLRLAFQRYRTFFNQFMSSNQTRGE
jgi:hypothetical protein